MYTLVPSPNKPSTDTGRPKSLCYLQASEAKQRGEITESEYFHHLFAHCTWAGEEHEDDEKYLGIGINWALRDADPLAYSISCWAKRMDPVDDATPFEDVFKAYRNGGVAEVEAALNALSKPDHVREFRKTLAMLALQERRADVLKMCLDAGGFSYESYFQDEANRLDPNKDPETDKVLEESDFRKKYPRKRWIPWEERGAKEERDSGEESDGEDEDNDDWEVDIAAFDEGGEFEIDW